MKNRFPENEEEFNRLMFEVDDELAGAEIPISKRAIEALSVVSQRFSILLPMSEPFLGMSKEMFENWSISKRIYKWYDNNYGNRQKYDFGIGRMAILIKNDLWVFRFPRIYGRARFVSSRTIISKKICSGDSECVYNILDCIEDMPPNFRMSLSNIQLAELFEHFLLGFHAMGALQSMKGSHELIESALADISASIGHLMAQNPQYGLCKWSSLQAAEKIIKAKIALGGGSFGYTHKLGNLVKQLSPPELVSRLHPIVDLIQCAPDIRYGKKICNKIEAAQAHYAIFVLILAIFKDNFHKGDRRNRNIE